MAKICKHCWHMIAPGTRKGNRLVTNYLCCHCGKRHYTSTKLASPEEIEAIVKEEEARHGPYKPH